MTGLSDNSNTDALRRETPNGDPLPGYHIYSRSERHANRVLPAFLTYQPHQNLIPSKPRCYPDERSRLLLEGLRNNGRFVLAGILIDLEDERRAEEVRAKKALEAEYAALKRKEEEKQSAAPDPISPEAEERAIFEQRIEALQRRHPQHLIKPTEQSEAEQINRTEQKVETEQTLKRAPSFDPEFDGDRGIFSDPLAEFDGADPFADFDGDHTYLHVDIDYGEDRGNLSDSDSEDDDSQSEEGSDRESEEDSSSEDEFDGVDPFADFDGDHTHLHVPFDFESESEEDNWTEPEEGRAPKSEKDVNQTLERESEGHDQGHDHDGQTDVNMDSIDEILAAAHPPDFGHEDEDEDEDMGDDVDLDYEDGEDLGEEDEHDMDSMPSAPFNPIAMGLKEIGGLAHFRVSSYKPGNGVDELKNDDTDRYWQYVSCSRPHLSH